MLPDVKSSGVPPDGLWSRWRSKYYRFINLVLVFYFLFTYYLILFSQTVQPREVVGERGRTSAQMALKTIVSFIPLTWNIQCVFHVLIII